MGRLSKKFVQFFAVLCSVFCITFLFNTESAFAGSYNGGGAYWRFRYNNLSATGQADISSSITAPLNSPWITGVEYVMAIDAGQQATLISGHAVVPIVIGANSAEWYLRPSCNSSTVKVGVSTAFWTYNATNLEVSNCKQYYNSSAVVGSTSGSLYAWRMEFDFKGNIPQISGWANLNIGFVATSSSDLIIQPTGTPASMSIRNYSILGSNNLYSPFDVTAYKPYFSVSVGSNQTDLQLGQVNSSIEQGNQQAQDRWEQEQAQIEQDKQQSQNDADNAQNDADNAQNEADSASSSLLDILKNFLGIITTAVNSEGSCDINLDFGYFDGGTQNLCQGFSHFRGIVSPIITVVMVGVIIGLAVAIIKNFMALFNLVFGGGM